MVNERLTAEQVGPLRHKFSCRPLPLSLAGGWNRRRAVLKVAGGERRCCGGLPKGRPASARDGEIHFGSAFVSSVGEAIFSLSSVQVLRTSAVTCEQFSIWRKTRLASSR
jgi:hypothetical protein